MLGGKNLEVTADNLIFDSGSSLNHIPVKEFNKIVQLITATHQCEPHMRPSTTYYCECDSVEDTTFPTMEIHTKSKVFNFKPRDYLILEQVPEKNNTKHCMISFQVLADSPVNNFWLLWDSFLRSTYSIYDIENNRIGFVADFTKTIPFDPITPIATIMPLVMLCCCILGTTTGILLVIRLYKT